MNNNHKKKIIAPIVITGIVVLYYVFYFILLVSLLDGIWKFILGIVPVLIVGVMLFVCKERIDEIKGGEEDDISKY